MSLCLKLQEGRASHNVGFFVALVSAPHYLNFANRYDTKRRSPFLTLATTVADASCMLN